MTPDELTGLFYAKLLTRERAQEAAQRFQRALDRARAEGMPQSEITAAMETAVTQLNTLGPEP